MTCEVARHRRYGPPAKLVCLFGLLTSVVLIRLGFVVKQAELPGNLVSQDRRSTNLFSQLSLRGKLTYIGGLLFGLALIVSGLVGLLPVAGTWGVFWIALMISIEGYNVYQLFFRRRSRPVTDNGDGPSRAPI